MYTYIVVQFFFSLTLALTLTLTLTLVIMASRGPISAPGGLRAFYGSEPPSHTVATGGDRCVLVPPFAWAMVVPGVYRSGYPMPLNYPFLERIGLRCIVSLEKVTADNEAWAKQQGIHIVELPCPENKVVL